MLGFNSFFLKYRRKTFFLLALSLFGVPTLYVAGYMSGIPSSFSSAVPISFGATLIRDLVFDIFVASLFGRLAVLLISSTLKIVSTALNRSGTIGEWRFVAKLRVSILITRKLFRRAKIISELVFSFFIFQVSHLGAWVSELFIMTAVNFFIVLAAGTWLTRAYRLVPRKENITKFSSWRVIDGAAFFTIMLVLYLSYSLGQHKLVYSALTCEEFKFGDGKVSTFAPVLFGENGVLVVSKIDIGTPFSFFSLVDSVEATFFPYSTIASISAESNNSTSSRADTNGASEFVCK